MNFVHFVRTLVINQPHMLQQIRIAATENTVINTVQPTDLSSPYLSIACA